ncbi:restriction endonuclease [Nocardia sp. XZ_19_385]|uniref:restriction endonuclease n=1 Tax=Nocardia sp. XZ_19_385 TaxID=2769488 RepID=UPI00188F93F1
MAGLYSCGRGSFYGDGCEVIGRDERIHHGFRVDLILLHDDEIWVVEVRNLLGSLSANAVMRLADVLERVDANRRIKVSFGPVTRSARAAITERGGIEVIDGEQLEGMLETYLPGWPDNLSN